MSGNRINIYSTIDFNKKLTLHVVVSGVIMIEIGLMTSKVTEGEKSMMELVKLSDIKKREEKSV